MGIGGFFLGIAHSKTGVIDCKSRTAELGYCHEGSKAERFLPQRSPRFKLIKGLAPYGLPLFFD
ncbi:hypothetical protein DDT91_19755 [Algoriphagus sp. AK58]|nr:hypothetical protein [Algoriphagus sp. AK58]